MPAPSRPLVLVVEDEAPIAELIHRHLDAAGFDVQHLTPGNKRGFIQARMRNIRTSTLSDQKFRAEEDVERATLDEREMQYLYSDGQLYYFMDTSNFEQIHISEEGLGDSRHYLVPDSTIRVEFYETEPVGIELPQTVDLVVKETVPGIKGATASAQLTGPHNMVPTASWKWLRSSDSSGPTWMTPATTTRVSMGPSRAACRRSSSPARGERRTGTARRSRSRPSRAYAAIMERTRAASPRLPSARAGSCSTRSRARSR